MSVADRPSGFVHADRRTAHRRAPGPARECGRHRRGGVRVRVRAVGERDARRRPRRQRPVGHRRRLAAPHLARGGAGRLVAGRRLARRGRAGVRPRDRRAPPRRPLRHRHRRLALRRRPTLPGGGGGWSPCAPRSSWSAWAPTPSSGCAPSVIRAAALLCPPGHLGTIPVPRLRGAVQPAVPRLPGAPVGAGRRSGPTPARPVRPIRGAGLAAGRHRGRCGRRTLAGDVRGAVPLRVLQRGVLDELQGWRHRPLLHADHGRCRPASRSGPGHRRRRVRAGVAKVGRRLFTTRGARRRWRPWRARWSSGSGPCCRRPRW